MHSKLWPRAAPTLISVGLWTEVKATRTRPFGPSSMRASDLALAALVVMTGCPAARAPDPAESPYVVPEGEPRSAGEARPFRPVAEWLSSDENLRLLLPEGWVSRDGTGDPVLLEARGPDGSGLDFVLRRWDGSPDSLEGFRADRVGWLSEGPYGRVAEIADGPPWVHSRPAGEGARDLEIGWHFVVEGRPYSFVATVPKVEFEAGVRRIRGVLDGFGRMKR